MVTECKYCLQSSDSNVGLFWSHDRFFDRFSLKIMLYLRYGYIIMLGTNLRRDKRELVCVLDLSPLLHYAWRNVAKKGAKSEVYRPPNVSSVMKRCRLGCLLDIWASAQFMKSLLPQSPTPNDCRIHPHAGKEPVLRNKWRTPTSYYSLGADLRKLCYYVPKGRSV